MTELRLPRAALSRAARNFVAGAFVAAALLASTAWPTAATAEERTACLLLDGRLVTTSEIVEIGASYSAPIARYDGAEAAAIVAALGALDPFATIAFPDNEKGSLIAFRADGVVRLYFIEAECLRAMGAAAPAAWLSAQRIALGDPT